MILLAGNQMISCRPWDANNLHGPSFGFKNQKIGPVLYAASRTAKDIASDSESQYPR
jgi:hypothetical protein